METVEDEGWDIRSVDQPTGGDDYIVSWKIIEHYMAEPHDRVVGQGDSILSAISNAIAAKGTNQ